MKVGIITVYKSENCGSYLQAWALKSSLEKMGCSVYFVPYKTSDNVLKVGWRIIKCCLKLRFRTAYFLLKRKILFNKAQRRFPIMNRKKKMDAFIFGSDTIWNFEDPFFRKNRFFFIGKGIIQLRYTYAISCGSTPYEFFEQDMVVKEEIARFDGISVRDEHMKKILERLFPEKHFLRVLDPTLLLGLSDYDKFACLSPSIKEFMFIYYFGKISEELFNAISLFAQKQRLKLVKMGSPDRRFDFNITNNPKEFIQYFNSAKYILTNTFYGCVFSVLFNKQFVTDGFYKKKVDDFMKRYNLQSQYLTEVDASAVEAKLITPINYNKINTEISKERDASLRFLNEIVIKGRTE